MQQMISRAGGSASRLWWARSDRRTLAAALVIEGLGRTAMLFFSPPDAPGVDRAGLMQLIGEISRDAIVGGMSLVQSLVDPQDSVVASVLEDSGMIVLAELIYMNRDLLITPPSPQVSRDDLGWRNYRQFTETQLGQVISQSYIDSADCPALRGVRRMPDVIAGHKCSGSFRPEAWWIVDCGLSGEPAGCILVNDSTRGPSADIIYMGVAPEFRRRGLARAMLDRTIAQAAERDRQWVSVAVDTRNEHALRIYQQCGFIEIHRKLAYVQLRRRGENSPS